MKIFECLDEVFNFGAAARSSIIFGGLTFVVLGLVRGLICDIFADWVPWVGPTGSAVSMVYETKCYQEAAPF